MRERSIKTNRRHKFVSALTRDDADICTSVYYLPFEALTCRAAEIRKLAWNGTPPDLRPAAWQILLVSLLVYARDDVPHTWTGLFASAAPLAGNNARSKTRRIRLSGGTHICARKRWARSTDLAPDRDRCAKDPTWRTTVDAGRDATGNSLRLPTIHDGILIPTSFTDRA